MVSKPKAAPHETLSSELSMPSSSDIIPEEWPELTDIAFKKSPSQQTCQQVTNETTSDTGTEHPTIARKAPCKFFPLMKKKRRRGSSTYTPFPLQQHHYLRKSPELVKVAKEDSKFSGKCCADLHGSETDVPPPVKKTTAARSVSPAYQLPTNKDTDKQSNSQKRKTTSPTKMSHPVCPKKLLRRQSAPVQAQQVKKICCYRPGTVAL